MKLKKKLLNPSKSTKGFFAQKNYRNTNEKQAKSID
jgi:hypothetical protein